MEFIKQSFDCTGHLIDDPVLLVADSGFDSRELLILYGGI
jgi:hypothetical protein